LKRIRLRQAGDRRGQDAEKQKEEATHRNSHEIRSILRDSPAAPAALGDRDPE
jgi:hypothetical protein